MRTTDKCLTSTKQAQDSAVGQKLERQTQDSAISTLNQCCVTKRGQAVSATSSNGRSKHGQIRLKLVKYNVFGLHKLAVAKRNRAVNAVFQLAHIAGPIMCKHFFYCVGRKIIVLIFWIAFQKMFNKNRNVFDMLS